MKSGIVFISPAEFERRMREISEFHHPGRSCDPEWQHGMADDLMCAVLRELGYGAGVEIFVKMEKWYS